MKLIQIFLISIFTGTTLMAGQQKQVASSDYNSLQVLFKEWREFEKPTLFNGVPDYSVEGFNNRNPIFQNIRNRLDKIKIDEWPISHQIDWYIILAEMNGYDFNARILKPWERDPAFYQTVWMHQSDVPDHEGPTNHATLEFWTYSSPLSKDDELKLKNELLLIEPFLQQARENLTGNARDLWVAGIENFKQQVKDLKTIKEKVAAFHTGDSLIPTINTCIDATRDFIAWLEQESPNKTGPSGIGKENYTWYQQNVHLLPLSWEEEAQLLQRELDRAWTSLKLEEYQNKELPEQVPANTPEEFEKLTEISVKKMMHFLDEKEIMILKPNMEPALRAHKGRFVPEKDRNFFLIGMHLDPLPLYSHFYHWFDLAQVRDEPHENPIRRGPLLYNIFDTKNEGIATGVEEFFMHAGLYEDNPRSREIVWIMIAQRAARGLGSLYAHANEMTMAEAGQVHVKWTPRGWMNREPHLLQFEQHLYLRQPGYGTCYITGKYYIEKLITEWAKQLEKKGQPFVFKDFLDAFNRAGNIPVSLVYWQLTGKKPPL
ncbi:MAG: hypothetical protein QF859_07475 [Candidatus Marinimicrobia bacterium]|jgi:hypothetical protein|nr:hypothetical protein [Candidatus Neomarinimicrobiota bacterium]MDP7336409.1 hypothetical protein [Candidatus Neomarinimicrobiota bacterium]MDP7475785.1 hypothetical protein [Candidatus Neomarinimicrobiota bacterium]MDP7564944.1 hypothetical protein [Candidatus Neomarinimicrobiota bacterium]